MNVRAQGYLIGLLLACVGGTLFLPWLYALFTNDGTAVAFFITLLASVAGGASVAFACGRPQKLMNNSEALFAVGLCWIGAGIVGALPYILAGAMSPIDALFESVSGFTTTGASVLTDIEALPDSLLLWRSMTQWLGGMGIIVFSLAILPHIGLGGMRIYRAEVPGPTPDKLTPRIRDTAKVLWTVYSALTAVLCVALWMAGMTFFDAINHSLTTLATGGFSTKNTSIAGYSASVQWLITLFMALAGINFTLHFQFIHRRWNCYLKSEECRFYLAVLAAFSIVVGTVLVVRGTMPLASLSDFEHLARTVLFQIVSLATSTGFASTDYSLWPVGTSAILLLVTFIGGCVGSTAGGYKMMRFMILGKVLHRELFKIIHPRAVCHIKSEGRILSESILWEILGFFLVYMLMLTLITMLSMLASDMDLLTAFSATLTCLSNVGPGFGQVGPVDNFAWMPVAPKLFLTFAMLLGRLEFYALLIAFVPVFWRK